MLLVVHDTYSSDCKSITNQSSNLLYVRYYNRDSYSKCKLKYSYEEKDFTCIKNSTMGEFHTGLRSHSKFRLFACER